MFETIEKKGKQEEIYEKYNRLRVCEYICVHGVVSVASGGRERASS